MRAYGLVSRRYLGFSFIPKRKRGVEVHPAPFLELETSSHLTLGSSEGKLLKKNRFVREFFYVDVCHKQFSFRLKWGGP